MRTHNRLVVSVSIIAVLAVAAGLGWILGAPTPTPPVGAGHQAAIADPPAAPPRFDPTQAAAAEPAASSEFVPVPTKSDHAPATIAAAAPDERVAAVLQIPPRHTAPEDTIERESHFASPETQPPAPLPAPTSQEPPAIPDLSEAHQALLMARQATTDRTPSPAPSAPAPSAGAEAPQPPAPSEANGPLVHLASFPDATTARRSCQELADRFPMLFAAAACVLRQVDLPKGRFVRVHARVPTGSDAATHCAPLKAAGQYCAPIQDQGEAIR